MSRFTDTMSYLAEAYSKLSLPISENDGDPGLRRAQIGAIHAIAAYFALPQQQPGIVVMPTGSGKTAVIFLAGFVLRSKRTLILTPSQLVRSQIAEEAASLRVLKKAKVFPEDFPTPTVVEVKSRLSSEEAWRSLEKADFVVATPQCVSPGIQGISEPPAGLFDLIVMDEGHHSQAPRWIDLTLHFQPTRQLLFTATPFRRDRRELKGRIIFSYPLRLAHEDRIFGDLRFIPVEPPHGGDHDTAIAQAAEATFQADKAAGFNHCLMVRTDSKKRADDLAKVYEQNTKLKLQVVHSGQSMKTIRKALANLASGEIDGIICVAMMGEGFDFPRLKIAAIHAPHKSLAVTLQFIGRFARTSGDKLGEAKFLAIPQDIQAETNELYRESAAWQDIVSNLSATRIEKEVRVKQITDSFSAIGVAETDVADVVLTDFKPYFHVKIYQIDDAPDLTQLPDFAEGVTVLRHEISEEYNGSILLMRQVTRPRWSDLDQFSRVEYDLVVIYYDESSNLLFINSSRRLLQFYKPFEDYYGKGTATLLAGPRINRVISDLQKPEFFSIGLKNTVQNSNTESYQIKSGPSAQNAISPTDGLLYQRGHLFGRGANAQGKNVTIGYSSSSKVWSNYTARIGEFIEWCQTLVTKLQTKGVVLTGTPLDALEIGEEIDALPDGVIGVGWPSNVYKDFPRLEITTDNGVVECQILDLELQLRREAVMNEEWFVDIEHANLEGSNRLKFTLEEGRPRFEWVDGHGPDIQVRRNDDNVALIDYLNHYPLAFFLDDYSRLDGSTLHRNLQTSAIASDHLLHLNWRAANIKINIEFPLGGVNFKSPTSVQCYLGADLIFSDAQVVFYDHGSGEMADFLTFKEGAENSIVVGLYHCKGAGGPAPGDRVSDAYEVCGQVVKCLIWLKNRELLRTRIMERQQSTGGKSRLIKGARNDLLRILADDSPKKMEFEIYVVQPGIAISNVTDKMTKILSAASDYVRRASGAKMFLIGSP